MELNELRGYHEKLDRAHTQDLQKKVTQILWVYSIFRQCKPTLATNTVQILMHFKIYNIYACRPNIQPLPKIMRVLHYNKALR